MNLIKVKINDLKLFPDGIELDFIAQQRVTEQSNSGLTHINGNIYRQNVLAIIGINASGKTTVLKVLSFVLDIYSKQGKLNADKYEFLYNENKFSIEAYFHMTGNKILKIESKIIRNKQNQLVFMEEKIWLKPVGDIKKVLYHFTNKQLKVVRSDEKSPYLTDDMSIMVGHTKNQEYQEVIDLINETNKNVMKTAGQIPVPMVNFLDKSIDYLYEERDVNNKLLIRLKFKGQDQEIYLTNHQQLESYLSSGTIKGLNVLAAVEKVFNLSGVLLIDEIENHFNKEIVRTIVKFFKDKKTNPKGATLVFTTHYSELLDDFERNDAIYITLKEKKLSITNLNYLLKRSDYKKSEVYQSSFVGPTAPSYDAYMELKKYFHQGQS